MGEDYMDCLLDHMDKRGLSIEMLKRLIQEVGHIAITITINVGMPSHYVSLKDSE